MTVSLYDLSVPVFSHKLENLRNILKKALAQAEARKIEPAVLVQARLFPDMFPLARQVQIATDQAKGCAARLTGGEPPRYEDTESTFAELDERIGRTVAFLGTLKKAAFDGAENRLVRLPVRDRTVEVLGLPYLLHYAYPNFYFHLTTAYAILRHNGIEVGKSDFLGASKPEDLAGPGARVGH
jgi:hypothetical protein